MSSRARLRNLCFLIQDSKAEGIGEIGRVYVFHRLMVTERLKEFLVKASRVSKEGLAWGVKVFKVQGSGWLVRFVREWCHLKDLF